MSVDFEALTLPELIALQSEVVATMNRRFHRTMVLVFSDVVGSTSYFARFGDVAGRALQQRHFDALAAVEKAGGRIVDTAGDGAFLCFESVDPAMTELVRINNDVAKQNRQFGVDHKLITRVGVHFGPVLSDGTIVSGDAVNLASRVAGSGSPGEIRLTKEAYAELGPALRVRCRTLAAVALKGFAQPVPLMTLEWLDRSKLPRLLVIRETNQKITLPEQDTISLGRLDEVQEDGTPANDIVLRHPDETLTERISRWHFELRRRDDALVCHAVSGQTIVDGTELARGDEKVVKSGSILQVAGVLTLMLLGDAAGTTDRHKETRFQ